MSAALLILICIINHTKINITVLTTLKENSSQLLQNLIKMVFVKHY